MDWWSALQTTKHLLILNSWRGSGDIWREDTINLSPASAHLLNHTTFQDHLSMFFFLSSRSRLTSCHKRWTSIRPSSCVPKFRCSEDINLGTAAPTFLSMRYSMSMIKGGHCATKYCPTLMSKRTDLSPTRNYGKFVRHMTNSVLWVPRISLSYRCADRPVCRRSNVFYCGKHAGCWGVSSGRVV